MRTVWLALLAAAVCVPFTLHALPSADLWWVLADGRELFRTGHIPLTDPFSYTAAGLPWHNDQWLVAALFYQVYQLGQVPALQLLKIALLTGTFALAVVQARKRSDAPGWAAVLAGLWCLAFSEHQAFFDVRAYLFSYLNLVLLWTLLQRNLTRPIPFLFLLWVNEHGAVTGGLALLALWTLFDRKKALTLALSAAATLVNPSGYHILLHAFRLTGSDWGRYLNEWQPHRPWPYVLFMLATLALLKPLNRPERAVLVGFAALSLTGWRHIPLFCWLAITPWTLALRRLPETRLYPVLAPLTAAAAAVLIATTPLANLSGENRYFPRWACDFIQANGLGERMLHPYGFGGYLLWRLGPDRKVAIDGRAAQVYPVETYVDYLRAARDPHPYAQQHGVTAIVTFKNPAMREVTSDLIKSWPKVYSDDLCEVFVPQAGHYTYPPSPQKLTDEGRPAEALKLDPDYVPALFLYGTQRLQANDPQGVVYLEEALARDPGLKQAHHNLAIWFQSRDPERARREAELAR